MKKNNHHKGFVILFTILIAAIIMVIGLGIYSIASRETVLSGTAREAQYAFYAADAGVECALYAQNQDNTTANPRLYDPNLSTGPNFNCGAAPVAISGQGTLITPFTMNVIVDTTHKTCAKVSVFDAGSTRRVISQGYNLCNMSTGLPLLSNPILVERDLDTRYNITGGTLSATGTNP